MLGSCKEIDSYCLYQASKTATQSAIWWSCCFRLNLEGAVQEHQLVKTEFVPGRFLSQDLLPSVFRKSVLSLDKVLGQERNMHQKLQIVGVLEATWLSA